VNQEQLDEEHQKYVRLACSVINQAFFDATRRWEEEASSMKNPKDRAWRKAFFRRIRTDAIRDLLDPDNLLWSLWGKLAGVKYPGEEDLLDFIENARVQRKLDVRLKVSRRL